MFFTYNYLNTEIKIKCLHVHKKRYSTKEIMSAINKKDVSKDFLELPVAVTCYNSCPFTELKANS